MFTVLKISKNRHFLTSPLPTSAYIICEWSPSWAQSPWTCQLPRFKADKTTQRGIIYSNLSNQIMTLCVSNQEVPWAKNMFQVKDGLTGWDLILKTVFHIFMGKTFIGHKILRNLPLTCDCSKYIQSNVRGKILWPSQNIWTLKDWAFYIFNRLKY